MLRTTLLRRIHPPLKSFSRCTTAIHHSRHTHSLRELVTAVSTGTIYDLIGEPTKYHDLFEFAQNYADVPIYYAIPAVAIATKLPFGLIRCVQQYRCKKRADHGEILVAWSSVIDKELAKEKWITVDMLVAKQQALVARQQNLNERGIRAPHPLETKLDLPLVVLQGGLWYINVSSLLALYWQQPDLSLAETMTDMPPMAAVVVAPVALLSTTSYLWQLHNSSVVLIREACHEVRNEPLLGVGLAIPLAISLVYMPLGVTLFVATNAASGFLGRFMLSKVYSDVTIPRARDAVPPHHPLHQPMASDSESAAPNRNSPISVASSKTLRK